MRNTFIAASAVLGLAGSAMAGGTTRFDVSFSDVDIFPGVIDGNAQTTPTADPGRYIGAYGWSNVDIDICWNDGSSYSGWASEVIFAMTMSDGTPEGTGLYGLTSPFAGDDTGTDTVGTCANRQALAELQTDFPAFTYQVEDSGDVTSGLSSTWDDGTGLRHSFCNTADFFFVLAGDVPAGCDGATGSCGEVHPEPGCADISCCALACDTNAGGDSFCCNSSWDSTCVDLAIALCGIFQYSCDAPGEPNDCVADAVMLTNGESAAFSTVNATNDGPAFTCAVGGTDGVFADVWFMVEVDAASDQSLTASTCNAADYDTALSLYDAGPIGSTFDPSTLPDVLVACNDDGAGCADFSSALVADVSPGRQYLVAVAGYEGGVGTGTLTVSWEDPAPQLDPPACDNPGDTVVSQITTAPENLTISGGVWCGAGAANVVARSYPASMFGGAFDVSCVDFGWFMNDDAYMPAAINLYVQDAANPLEVTSQEQIATTAFGLYTNLDGYTISSQAFDSPVAVDLADGEFLMVEVFMERQLQAPAGEGYGGYFGVVLADTDGAESYISCGGDYFGTMTDIGFTDYQAYITLNGTGGGSNPCPADFNGDGVVNGADFGSILAAWGPCSGCPEDLNGDGVVNGADVGGILAAWGPCP